MLTATVLQIQHHRRSKIISDAMANGIRHMGDKVIRHYEGGYRAPDSQVVCYYGHEGRNIQAAKDYQAAGGKAVYCDLGWFGRRYGGRWTGYHKVVVNSRHPNAYFQRRSYPVNRARFLNVTVKPWKRTGRFILLAGMSDRCAISLGYKPNQWEREAIDALQKVTDRPIVYRPKPSWKGATPLAGTTYSVRPEEAEHLYPDCWAVVTHHSNVAVEGLVEGIPAFCWDGVAVPMASQDITQIENPVYPAGREQWIANICWQQWSVEEIRQGLAWRHLKDEGLIP